LSFDEKSLAQSERETLNNLIFVLQLAKVLIFVIVDCCTKIIKYIFVITRIDIAKLAKIFFDKIVLRFETSTNIISDREFVFTNIF